MRILLYLFIFSSKTIENALGTLRVIVVANGKKTLSAVLQAVISVMWITAAGAVVINVTKDPLKIVFFALGSGFGSYLGSFIEQKMALGSNMITSIVDQNFGSIIANKLRDQGYAVTVLSGEGKDKLRSILMIMVPRKDRFEVVDIIKTIDENSMVVSGNARAIYGGYMCDSKDPDL